MAVSLLVSGAALVFVFRGVNLGEFREALGSARGAWLAAALLVLFFTFAARALRWAVLMGGAPFWTTFHALTIGYMMNSVLPLRAGEVGRAFVVSEHGALPIANVLSSVIVERVLDLAAVLLLVVVCARSAAVPPVLSHAASVLTAGLALVVPALGLLVWKSPAVERALRPRTLRWGRWMEKSWLRFGELCSGFRTLSSARQWVSVLAMTVVVWALTVLMAYMVMAAFLPPVPAAAALVVAASGLGGALPSAPGGFGIVQAFGKMALVVPFAIPEDKALAFVFVWSVGQQIFLIVLGAMGLARFGMTMRQAHQAAAVSEVRAEES